jgi:hypothetical protein
MEIHEGGTSKIHVDRRAGTAQKILKRKGKGTQRDRDLSVEREVHREIQRLLEEETSFRVRTPRLLEAGDKYLMEFVDTSKPLWDEDAWALLSDSDEVRDRLMGAIRYLGSKGILLRDVEAYLQTDRSVVILDFGQVSRGVWTGSLSSACLLPASVTEFDALW